MIHLGLEKCIYKKYLKLDMFSHSPTIWHLTNLPTKNLIEVHHISGFQEKCIFRGTAIAWRHSLLFPRIPRYKMRCTPLKLIPFS